MPTTPTQLKHTLYQIALQTLTEMKHTLSLVVFLVTGINSLEAIPVLLAGVLSHAIVAGFRLIKPPRPAKSA